QVEALHLRDLEGAPVEGEIRRNLHPAHPLAAVRHLSAALWERRKPRQLVLVLAALPRQVLASAPTDVSTRMQATLEQLQLKLLHLVTAIPLLVVAIAIVWLAVLFGRLLARRPMRWLREHQRNPFLEGLVRRLVQALVVIL